MANKVSVSRLYELKNLETGRQLKTTLKRGRKAGKSYRTLADELSQSGSTVGKTAVQEWCRILGIE
jgi:hypothetical protein